MTNHERQSEVQDSVDKIGSAILGLGITPELIAELNPEEARFVTVSIAKALSTLVHPDRSSRNDILGLGIGDVNYLGSLVNQANEQEMSDAIAGIAETSAKVSAHRRAEQLSDELSEVVQTNKNLAMAVIRSHEAYSDHVSMSFLLLQPDNHPDSTSEGINITVKDGVITEATATVARSSLLSALPSHIEKKLLKIYSDIDTNKGHYVNLDTTFPDDESLSGWARLVAAKSKKNPNIKKPAIQIYNPKDEEAYSVTDLMGARMIGSYSYTSGSDYDSTLSLDSMYEKSLPLSTDDTLTLKVHPRIRDDELAYLFGRGYARTLTSDQELMRAPHFILRKSDHRSGGPKNYITSGVIARTLL